MQEFNPFDIKPEYVAELVERAITKAEEYIAANDLICAQALLGQAQRCDQHNPRLLRLLGQVFIQAHNPASAIKCYQEILDSDPNDFEAMNNIALCHSDLKEYDKAIALLEEAIKLHPLMPSGYCNLALVYKKIDQTPKAINTIARALCYPFFNADLYFHYGCHLSDDLRRDEALLAYDHALALDKDHHLARWNRGIVKLGLGLHGWDDYEARWDVVGGYRQFRERFNKPAWQGQAGWGRLLVFNEQGVGDSIQFARYLPQLKALGWHVIAEVHQGLINVIQADEVIPQFQTGVEFDCHVSFNSLPLFLEMPDYQPYLAPTGKIPSQHFADYAGKKKIGICWAGSPQHPCDKDRSMLLRYFKPLHDLPNVKLFSLQKDTESRFQADAGVVDLTEGAEGMSIVNMSDVMLSWNYTAAIVDQMDVIVTVDTAIAHLAGAMNKPCCLLLAKNPDWRWGLETATTKWYPSLRLFRKNTNWEDAISEVVAYIT